MESRLVAEFVEHTGADAAVAYNTLQANGFDLHQALGSHNLHVASLASHNHRGVPPPVAEENGNLDDVVTDSSALSVSRPPLQKAEAVEIADNKKLTRGISRATDNVNLVSIARCNIAHDFTENTICNVNQYFIETPVYTFTLPDLTIYPDDFREFLEKDLIEISCLLSLEQCGRLNWWSDCGACQRLWPLATTGDGNCLLHAASLGMWGFHDRLLTLRKALHGFMTSSECRDALWRRWRWQQTRLNAEAGFVYSEDEWLREWADIVSMASTEPRRLESGARRRSMVFEREEAPENATYESLEEIHIFALAHVLRRPIVIVADVMLKDVHGEDLAPIPFGGVYIPLECSPADCHRSPLVLSYDSAHFSALVVMEKESTDRSLQPIAAIPLTDSDHSLLPIQFSVDPGEQFLWGCDELKPHVIQKLSLANKEKLGLLREYLDVVDISIPPVTPHSDENLGEEYIVLSNDEEEIDKRFAEALDTDLADDNLVSESNLFNTNKSKAAKQLQSVAKQFGSIGKSMSKKIKKNFGSIGKLTRNNSQKKDLYSGRQPTRQASKSNSAVARTQNHILCAILHTETRHEYQEEMIRNYLQSARARFQRDKGQRHGDAVDRQSKEAERLKEVARLEGPTLCINPGCNMYGTAITSYMCTACFEKQRDQELSNLNSPSLSRAVISNNNSSLLTEPSAPRYGTGKSQFYTESDANSHNVISKLPLSRAASNVDQTLYLSKSTFYNDSTVNLDNKGYYTHELDMRNPNRLRPSPVESKPSPNNWRDGTSSVDSTSKLLTGMRHADLGRFDSSSIRAEPFAGSSRPDQVPNNRRTWDSAPVSGRTLHSISSQASGPAARSTLGPGRPESVDRNTFSASPGAQSNSRAPSVDRVRASLLAGSIQVPFSGAQPCRTASCKFFGNAELNYLCSKCHKELLIHVGGKGLKVAES